MTAPCPTCETSAHCKAHGCIPVSGDAPVGAAHRVVCDGQPEFAAEHVAEVVPKWATTDTLPVCDDLIWLYDQSSNTIEGPVIPGPSYADEWTHWAYADAPSTAAIDAVLAAAPSHIPVVEAGPDLPRILTDVVALAKIAHGHWDADRDSKVGKLLLALAGWNQGYDRRADNLHAAIAGMGEGGWRPIETAPKEVELLGWREDCGPLLIMHTSYDRFAGDRECDEMDEDSLFQKDWFGAGIPFGMTRLEGSEVPTHWMALPEAPK